MRRPISLLLFLASSLVSAQQGTTIYPVPDPNFPNAGSFLPIVSTNFSEQTIVSGCQDSSLNGTYSNSFTTSEGVYPPFWYWAFSRVPLTGEGYLPFPNVASLPQPIQILTVSNGVSQGQGGPLTGTAYSGTYPAVLGSGPGYQITYKITVAGSTATEQYVINAQRVDSASNINDTYSFSSIYDIQSGSQTYTVDDIYNVIGTNVNHPGCLYTTKNEETGTGYANYYTNSNTSPQIHVTESPDGPDVQQLRLRPTKYGNKFRPHREPKDLYVDCRDQSDNPVPCSISIQLVQKGATSGGHFHAGPAIRPLGEIVDAANQSSLSQDGASLQFTTLQEKADPSGQPVHILYLPSLVGGDYVMQVTGSSLTQYDVALRIVSEYADCSGDRPTLCALPPGAESNGNQTYRLTGVLPGSIHPQSHFGTSTFNGVLASIANYWFTVENPNTSGPSLFAHSPVPPLAINDMTLVDGGVFDLNGTWQPNAATASTPGISHKYHRWGDEADVGSGALPAGVNCPLCGGPANNMPYWIPPQERARFLAILQVFGYKAISENTGCKPGTTTADMLCNHYHIQPAQ